MTLYDGVDASKPSGPLPRGTSLLFGYIGAKDLSGQPDTPHVWTTEEWDMYLSPHGEFYRGPQVRPVPIYVHDYPGDPIADAHNAIDAMQDLGWAMEIGRLLYWDAEQLIDTQYANALTVECMRFGVRLGKYGQLSTIEQDPPMPGGTWFAQYQGHRPEVLPVNLGVAWQWATPEQVGGTWDRTVATPFVYANAGRGIRRIEA